MGGRKRGRETSMCGCLSCAPSLGTWPATQACALTGNRTGNSGLQSGPQSTEPHQPSVLFDLFLIYAFINCFLYMPWLETEPETLAYWDKVLTKWVTWPGLKHTSNTSACVCPGYLWEDTQELGGCGCLWEEGWDLLFTVYLLYLLNFVPCMCIIYSKKVFKLKNK